MNLLKRIQMADKKLNLNFGGRSFFKQAGFKQASKNTLTAAEYKSTHDTQ